MLVLLAIVGLAAPPTPQQLVELPTVGDARISPDGTAAVYVLTTTDLEEDCSSSDLWYVPISPGGDPVQLTTHPGRDHSPRWSPDGQGLVFVSDRSGSPQLWRFDGFFGEPHQITDHAGGASNPVWTPDGQSLLFLSRGPEPEETDAIQPYTDLLYRKGRDGRTRHVFSVQASGGEATQLTQGERDWGEVSVSPDGSRLAAVREPEHTGGLWSIDTDVWLVPMEGGEGTLLTVNPGPDHDPRFAADGRVLTRSILEEGYESGKRRLMLWDPDGAEPVELTRGIDRACYRVELSADGKAALALLDGPGTWHVAHIPLDQPGQMKWVTQGDAWVWGMSPSARGRLLLEVTAGDRPTELYLIQERSRGADLGYLPKVRQLTHHSDPLLEAGDEVDVEELQVEVGDRHIQAFYSPPATPVEGPPPLVVKLHGGPQWQEGHYWHPDRQALASAGYAVLSVSFTGSTGHGQAFVDAIAGDWGGAPLEDVMAALDQVIAEGRADPERVAITGGSYGGFLAAHALVTHPDRFAAAIPERGVYDQVSMYGVTDEQFFPEKDLLGTPWEQPAVYAAASPLLRVRPGLPPTLIIHGGGDQRVPVSQAHELFTALLRHQVPAELMVFPGGHGFARRGPPSVRVQRWEAITAWLERWMVSE